jgi:hypothetical protein
MQGTLGEPASPADGADRHRDGGALSAFDNPSLLAVEGLRPGQRKALARDRAAVGEPRQPATLAVAIEAIASAETLT